MNKVYISKEYNPYFNIALENYLFNNSDDGIILYLWQNDKSVIIGRNQNILAEADIDYLEKNNIYPVRRLSGGGAVYHDKGNLNFTIITKEKNANQEDFINFLKKVFINLGIDFEFSGRNDLLYKGKKFSGHAYYVEDENYMYHGTIMIDVDLNELTKALTPSNLKLESKGIESVRSRVINLSEINNKINIKTVINSFISTFNCDNIVYMDIRGISLPLEKKLSSKDWIFNESPKFNISLEKKYNFGNININVMIDSGLIVDVFVNTDSLEILDFSKFEEELINKEFNESIIWKTFENYYSN